jgi:hypothetical protein
MNKRVNNRPHPSPLPQEREIHRPPADIFCGWICQMFSRESRNSRRLFPLPEGEGQGEGGGKN